MSKKQSFWVIAIFLMALLSSLIISLPARHILQFVEIPAEIKIQGLQGSITDGRVQVFSYNNFYLKNIDFNIQPLCFLKAGLCYQLRSTDKELLVNVEINLLSQNISLSQREILLASDNFKDIPQLLAQPTGELAIFVETLIYGESKIKDLVGKVNWLGAGIQGEDQLFGNYNAQIVKQTDGLNFTLSDQDSLLSVMGDIDVNWNGQYDVDLKLESRPTLNKSVISVLEMTTKKSGLNRFSLKRSGKVSPAVLKYLTLFESNI